jgi:uncharacterized protein (TIGR02285 family)
MSLIGFIFLVNAWAAEMPPHLPKPPLSISWAFSSMSTKASAEKTGLLTRKDELFRLYQIGFREYQNQEFTATIPRIEQELKTKNLVCYAGSSDAERRKKFSYLTSQYVQPAPKIIMLKSLANKLLSPGKKTLALRELIKNQDLVGVVGESRSYGPSIDKIITPMPSSIKPIVLETFSASSMQMIINKRADYTIEYSFVIKALIENKQQYQDIVAIPISDIDPVMVQYLACSKTPEGLAVIKRADKIIRENVQNSAYWSGVLKTVSPHEQASFKAEIQRFIEMRKKASIIIE